ncbi:MAG: hypothetical protein IPM88_11130 [Nitrospira sp.]|nr:hypothetical protein [Nitrospira sp.]
MKTPTTTTLPLMLKSLCLPTFAREYAIVAAQAPGLPGWRGHAGGW